MAARNRRGWATDPHEFMRGGLASVRGVVTVRCIGAVTRVIRGPWARPSNHMAQF
jgi:hypothetical protein